MAGNNIEIEVKFDDKKFKKGCTKIQKELDILKAQIDAVIDKYWIIKVLTKLIKGFSRLSFKLECFREDVKRKVFKNIVKIKTKESE